jgi:MFS family permease
MAPVARLLILRTVDKHGLVDAMALLTIPGLMGPLLGPPIGGFITTYFSWHWIFLINVPIGLVGIVLITRFVEDVRVERVDPIDFPGLVLCGIAVAGLAFGLSVAGFDILPWPLVSALIAGGAVAALAYFMHARRIAAPALDFSLMALPTFRASVLGGSLFRIGVGAMPFLLPLLFQLGFGMTPLQSGLMTFTSAMGALVVKAFAKRILTRWGFRRVLVGNALIASAFIAACALINPKTAFPLIVGILFVGGFFRSLEFTCINALSFADVDSARMSRATTLSAVWQQLSLSMGVALGAFIVEFTLRWKRDPVISVDDFTPAFLIVGCVSALAVFSFMRLPRDAGAHLSAPAPTTEDRPPDASPN